MSTTPDVEERVGVTRDLPKGRSFLNALCRGVAADHENNAACVAKGRVACRPAGEPVEVEALVVVTERIERIGHPDASTGQRDLLCWDGFGEDRRPAGAAERLVEQRLARAPPGRPTPQTENRQRQP